MRSSSPAAKRLLVLIAAGIGASCDPMGRTGLPVDGAGGATSSSAQTSASTSASTSSSQSSSSASSTNAGVGGFMTPRRPFLVGASLRTAGSRPSREWLSRELDAASTLDDATRELLAAAWSKDAREEHASVAAFARWSMLMLSVGAPPAFVRDSQRASLDEIRHAMLSFSMAKRYGAGDVGPAELDLEGAVAPRSLPEIARLTAEEGCVGETLGASLAAEQERICLDPVVRRVLRTIARDEERHAKLAWGFVSWAIRRGGPPVAEAVFAGIERASRETLEAEVRSYDGIDLDAWRAHGRLTCTEARALARETIRTVLEPATALLRASA